MKDELREAATNIKTSEVERTWQAYLTLPYRSKSEYKALVHGYAAGYEAGKPKWIPVSERLPTEYGAYLGWGIHETGIEAGLFLVHWSVNRHKWAVLDSGRAIQVIAWQPLPEPYTEGE